MYDKLNAIPGILGVGYLGYALKSYAADACSADTGAMVAVAIFAIVGSVATVVLNPRTA